MSPVPLAASTSPPVKMDEVDWESCLLAPVRHPERERLLRRALGSVPHAARFFLDSQWITDGIVLFDMRKIPLAYVTPALLGPVAIVVSQDNSCRYCYGATRSFLRILGYPRSFILELEEGLVTARISPDRRKALTLVRRVSRANPLPMRADAEPLLAADWSPAAVRELVFLAAMNVFYNRIATLPALPLEPMEQMSRRWFVRLLRPLIARSLRHPPRVGPTASRAAADPGAPFATLLAAVDGLPVAEGMISLVEAALASPVLPRRSKALVFAAVARALGCPVSERDATRMLIEEGLTEAGVAGVLANLSGLELDARETAIAQFARATVWYRPVDVQRHARRLHEQLNHAEFVELVGIASLANALCRLSAAAGLAQA